MKQSGASIVENKNKKFSRAKQAFRNLCVKSFPNSDVKCRPWWWIFLTTAMANLRRTATFWLSTIVHHPPLITFLPKHSN